MGAESGLGFGPGSARRLPGEGDAMGHAARQAEYGPQRQAVAGSEKCSVGHRARQGPQRSVFSAQQIIGEIQGSEHVERVADDADQCECVFVDNHHGRVTDWPFFSTRNESPGAHAIRRHFGVSMPSSPSWKVPWWIAMLVSAPRI